jgi:gliding motility-associated-like protein
MGSTGSLSNYSVSYVSGVLTVTSAPLTVTANNLNKTYGSTLTGSTGSTEFTVIGLLNSETIGSVTVSYGSGALATASVGTYTNSVSVSAATGGTFTSSNYSITYIPNALSVTKASLTVRGPNLYVTYGDVKSEIISMPEFRFTSQGYKNLDNQETILSGVNMVFNYFPITPASSEVAIDFDFATNASLRSNYDITWIPGKIIVKKAVLHIKADAKDVCEGTTKTQLVDNMGLIVTGYKNRESLSSAINGQIVNFITNYTGTSVVSSNAKFFIVPDMSLASSTNYELRVDTAYFAYGKLATLRTITLDALCNNGVNLFNYVPVDGVDGIVPAGTKYTWSASNNSFITGSSDNLVQVENLGAGQQLMSVSNSVVSYFYTVSPYNNGCKGSDFKLIVNVKPLPTVDAIADVSICVGTEKAITFSGSSQADIKFFWTNSNKLIGVDSEGIGNFVIKSVSTLSTTAESVIRVKPYSGGCYGPEKSFKVQTKPTPSLPEVINASQAICAGDLTSPIAFVDKLGSTINWSINQVGAGIAQRGVGNIPSFKAINSGTTPLSLGFVVTPELNGCVGPSATLATININTPVISQIDTYPAYACPDGVVGPFKVDKSTGGDFYSYNYSWQVSKDSTNFISIANSNNYRITAPPQGSTAWYRVVTESGGCKSTSSSVKVSLRDKPKVKIALATTTATIGVGNSIQVFAGGAETYEWTPKVDVSNPFVSNPFLSPKQTSAFTVKGTDLFGCTAEDVITVNVDQNYSITPNVIVTPNGDTVNDTWEIRNIEFYPKNSIQLYDSQGGLIKQFDNYTGGWDGTINGVKLPVGNYYYLISINEGASISRGFVTILY